MVDAVVQETSLVIFAVLGFDEAIVEVEVVQLEEIIEMSAKPIIGLSDDWPSEQLTVIMKGMPVDAVGV